MNDDTLQARFDRQHAASRSQPAPDAAARRDLGLSEADVFVESNRPAWNIPAGWLR